MKQTVEKRTKRATGQTDLGASSPRLVVCGIDSDATILDALAELAVEIVRRPSPEVVVPADRPLGVVLVERERVRGATATVARSRARLTCPIFVVAPDGVSDPLTRKLYEAGASAVFEWPRESLMLGRFVAEMLALRRVRGRAVGPDTALARTVRAHLKTLSNLPEVPRVTARQGDVEVTGNVASLQTKREIERCAARVPGVRNLDTAELAVLPQPVSDSELRKLTRGLLHTADLDPAKTRVKVEQGHLVLEGSARDRHALERFEERVCRIDGLKSVAVRIGPSSRRTPARAPSRAALAATIASVFPDCRLEVRLLGRVAELSGTVGDLATRRAVVSLVEEAPGIARVVDKIDVESHS